jgi:hypothetical protein
MRFHSPGTWPTCSRSQRSRQPNQRLLQISCPAHPGSSRSARSLTEAPRISGPGPAALKFRSQDPPQRHRQSGPAPLPSGGRSGSGWLSQPCSLSLSIAPRCAPQRKQQALNISAPRTTAGPPPLRAVREAPGGGRGAVRVSACVMEGEISTYVI